MKKPPAKKDLLSLLDLTARDIEKILSRAAFLKKNRKKRIATLRGKTLAMIFEKPSTRTKMSFDVAMYELGGHSVTLDSSSSQLGRGETYEDTGRVIDRYAAGIMIRTFSQENCEKLAKSASIPVISGLTDLHHPCQVLADLLTVRENFKKFPKLTVAYVGDGNNMANTWITAAMILPRLKLRVATPKGYEPEILKTVDTSQCDVTLTQDPVEAVRGAHVVNTDTWFSMGQEVSNEKRRLFESFQVNRKLMSVADSKAIVLHCLPAHRGEEITDEVLDGPQSRVFDQAENRLHVQKAVLEMLLK